MFQPGNTLNEQVAHYCSNDHTIGYSGHKNYSGGISRLLKSFD